MSEQIPPVLVDLTRGRGDAPDLLVESRHRGALAIVSCEGERLVALGDVDAPIYPRSAIKPLQALPFVSTGAANAFGFGAAELAVAQASHDAQPEHLTVVRAMLGAMELGEGDLACGKPTRRAPSPHADGGPLTPLHHECSGKHAGMLALARHLGAGVEGYECVDHPAQVAVREAIEAVTGARLTLSLCGTDGCSLPTWAAPTAAFASGFARLAAGSDDPTERAGARLVDAVHAAPEMIWGRGQFDTWMAEALAPFVLTKRGAEGVFCGLVRPNPDAPTRAARKGFGFAVKVEDGANRAARVVAASILQAALKPVGTVGDRLAAYAAPAIRTARGVEVGRMRAAKALRQALNAL